MNTEYLHNSIWHRFIRMPYGHLLDAADTDGNAFIPTAEECRNCIPNIMSYTTSIADCAFFGGLYLYGLCEKYDLAPDEKLKQEINILVDGLLLLCDVSKVDGFIARGVADDGVTHYPTTTVDQVGPWLLGIWRVIHSTVADDDLCNKIRPRLIRTLKGIVAADWHLPIEWKGKTNGGLVRKDWRGVSQLLFSAAAARELGIITNEDFEKLVSEKPDNGIYNRAEIASNGFSGDMIRNTILAQFWINIPAQLALRELVSLDTIRSEYYKHGLSVNGTAVIGFLRDFDNYNKDNLEFNHNWREIIPEIQPWATYDEAFKEAQRLNGLWGGQYNRLRDIERRTISQAFFGAWIAIVSGNEKAVDYAYKCLCEAVETVDWDKVGQSYAFAVEAAIYCYEKSK